MAYTKKIDLETLIDNAYHLVEREGREAVSMRRLAGIGGVRASSLYNHFPDKANLLRSISEKGLFHLATHLEHAFKLAGTEPRYQIQAMGSTYREWALQNREIYLLLFADAPPLDEGSLSVTAAFGPILAATSQLVGEQEAPAATQAIWSFVHGFAMLELSGHMQQCIPIEGFQIGLSCLVNGLGR